MNGVPAGGISLLLFGDGFVDVLWMILSFTDVTLWLNAEQIQYSLYIMDRLTLSALHLEINEGKKKHT